MWGRNRFFSQSCPDVQNTSARPASIDVSRRRFIRTTTGGVILAATAPTLLQGCSPIASVPASALDAWHVVSESDDIRRWALAHAILAPNPHNLQPWLVDLATDNEINVSLDPERLLPETDPFGRQIIIGTGAMLGLLELAAATKGYDTDITWLGSDEKTTQQPLVTGVPLIKVRLNKSDSVQPHAHELFEQIRHRHTVRDNYDRERSPDPEFISRMAEFNTTNQSFGSLTESNTSTEFEQVSQWVKKAWEIELSTPATMMESVRLLRVGSKEIDQHRDGIVIDSPLIVMLSMLGLMDRSEPPAPGSSIFNRQIDSFNESVESTPGWFWLSSDDNHRIDQVKAGRTYVLAQLQATQMGMVMHPVSQGLQEYKEMTPVYQPLQQIVETLGGRRGQTLQMLARIGYLPENAEAPTPSPRRGLEAHIM